MQAASYPVPHTQIVRRRVVPPAEDTQDAPPPPVTLNTTKPDHRNIATSEEFWSHEDLMEMAAKRNAAASEELWIHPQHQSDAARDPTTAPPPLRRPMVWGAAPPLRSAAPQQQQQQHALTPSPPNSPSPTEGSVPAGQPLPPSSARRGTTPQQILRAFVSDNPWDTLHAQPALAVVGGTTALSMISAYILQNHVLDTHDHLGVFLFGSYLIFSSYFMVYYFLERFSTSFRKISQDKKFYTIGNLLKAGVLVSITPFAVYNLMLVLVYDTWESNTLRNLGCIYAIPDFVSMVVVRRMAWTTWLHHICVCLFNYFSIHNDYAQENVCRLIVVYACFSTFAYCVNMLLASRFLGVSAQVSRVLSFVALCVYVFCCAVNWVWQAHYLRRLIHENDHWTIYLYMTLICFVMWDDIVLNRWLLQNARNTHGGILAGGRQHQDGGAVARGATGPRRGIRGACC